jgi:Family of unknown function (DUF5397)
MNAVVQANGLVTMPLSDVVGSFRTFGRNGPLYEVVAVGSPATGAAAMLKIRVVESGEVLSYSLNDALLDPIAR